MWYLATDAGCKGKLHSEDYKVAYGVFVYKGIDNYTTYVNAIGGEEATSQKGELYALIAACRMATYYIANGITEPMCIITDSGYGYRMLENEWYQGWIKNNWRKSDGEPVKNKKIIEELVTVWLHLLRSSPQDIVLMHTKGHLNNLGVRGRAAYDESFHCDKVYDLAVEKAADLWLFKNGQKINKAKEVAQEVMEFIPDDETLSRNIILNSVVDCMVSCHAEDIY